MLQIRERSFAGGEAFGSPGGWSAPASVGTAATGAVGVGVGRRLPWERVLIETDFGSHHDAWYAGHIHAVCSGRSHAATEVHANPSAWFHASFRVRDTGLDGKRAASERQIGMMRGFVPVNAS
eukprot:6210093-Pleurochrysis_carterae.AAC.1